ncbi:MAG: hypothetical protein EXQ58_10480 [Acidobacteria bacterium]|nr:hypothetical protein [Acidobacteriota bacterium]
MAESLTLPQRSAGWQFVERDQGTGLLLRLSIPDQEKLEKIILPTEFQNLKDFQTFLKIANYGITRMEAPKSFLPTVAPEFLPRDFGLEQMLKEEPQSPASMPRAEIPQFAP